MLTTCLRTVIFAVLFSWLCQKSTYAAKVINRIVNGRETGIDKAPFLVNLQYDGDFICGGSLISRNHVLTAAHCVKGKPSRRITIRAGSTDRLQGGISRSVSAVWIPEVFTMRNNLRDAAVLKLAAPINDTNVQIIGLCNSPLMPGNVLQVYGWGITNENSRIQPRTLRTVSVPVMRKRWCVRRYRNYLHLTESMFCAAGSGRRDSCTGDSGGPAVFNGRVCGIVSFGVGCARPGYPGVYTSIPAVRNFIDKAILL